MGKRVPLRRIKTHRQYTYDQAATALGVSPQTVRGWRSKGLPVLTSQTPHLIVGAQLEEFLSQRVSNRRVRLGLGQFRCMRCGGLVEAYGGMVDYTPVTPTRGVLSTLCAGCEGTCTKFASLSQAEALTEILSLAFCNSSEA